MECGTRIRLFIIPRRFDPDGSAVRFQDSAGDGKPQAGSSAFELGFAAGVQPDASDLPKLLEDNGLVLL